MTANEGAVTEGWRSVGKSSGLLGVKPGLIEVDGPNLIHHCSFCKQGLCAGRSGRFHWKNPLPAPGQLVGFGVDDVNREHGAGDVQQDRYHRRREDEFVVHGSAPDRRSDVAQTVDGYDIAGRRNVQWFKEAGIGDRVERARRNERRAVVVRHGGILWLEGRDEEFASGEKIWHGAGMDGPDPASTLHVHRFRVAVECDDSRLEGEPEAKDASRVLADEIVSNLQSLHGIGAVQVEIEP